MSFWRERRSSQLGIACLGALCLGACNAAVLEKPSIPELSVSDRASNAAKVSAFVRQQCGDVAEDSGKFDASLQATGWKAVRQQTVDPNNPLSLDMWQLQHGTVLRGEIVKGAAWTCAITLSADVAPSIDEMRAGLHAFASDATDKSGELEWRADRLHIVRLTVDEGTGAGGPSLWINSEIYRLPWWRALLG